MNSSTADRFIAVMAMIQATEYDGTEPMRHEIQECKLAALGVLDSAIKSAHDMIRVARNIPKTAREASDDAVAAAAPAPESGDPS
jgi:hypothetical protein